MREIEVNASGCYRVRIGHGLIRDIRQQIQAVRSNCTVAVISDSNVWPLYGDAVTASLEKNGYTVFHYVFPAGEESKTGATYLDILNFLAQNHLTRSDLLIALGGGVVGDVTGFVAATYLRGVACIQVPTSLLAMVDSSVGGKTAIDLPAGKNLVGAFYQPSLVLCDISALDTLPENIFRDGCAEVIKYGILYDAALFARLAADGPAFDRESVIARCVELKRDVVMEDEFDTGSRQKLNLGHTFGHGVEAHSHFTLSHGKAVAIGMAIAARASYALGLCTQETVASVERILTDFSLPIHTDYTAQQLFAAALSDKKRSGGSVNLILPRQIGCCDICPTPIQRLATIIEAGM